MGETRRLSSISCVVTSFRSRRNSTSSSWSNAIWSVLPLHRPLSLARAQLTIFPLQVPYRSVNGFRAHSNYQKKTAFLEAEKRKYSIYVASLESALAARTEKLGALKLDRALRRSERGQTSAGLTPAASQAPGRQGGHAREYAAAHGARGLDGSEEEREELVADRA